MISIAVVCEARADHKTVTTLTDRLINESVEWIEVTVIDSFRAWLGEPILWKHLNVHCAQFRIKAHGHFGGEPQKPDSVAALKALRFLFHPDQSIRPNIVILMRDQDDQPERRDGLRQGVTEFLKSFTEIPIVIGFPIIERESWVLSGYIPDNDHEKTLLADERQKLGFNPTKRPEMLTAAKDDQAKKSPKRVLRVLIGGEAARETRCLVETSIDILKANGANNGLREFICEVESTLPPLLGAKAKSTG